MHINKTFLTIASISWSLKIVVAQAPVIKWQKSFGGSDFDSFGSLVTIGNGDIILNGSSNSTDLNVSGNHGQNDVWLVKLDSSGNLINEKCLGGSNSDAFNSCVKFPNGNLIFAGGTTSNDGNVSGNHSTNTYDGWLVETDTSLNIIRQKCFGGSDNEGFNSVSITSDGGLILSGITASVDGDLVGINNHGGGDVWILKLNNSWDIQWQKCFGGSYDDYGVGVVEVSSNKFVVGSYAGSFDGDITAPLGGYDFWIFAIDTLGTKLWDKSYGGSSDEYLNTFIQTPDSRFILAGRTTSQDGFISGSHDSIFGVSDYWIIKLDSQANFLWQKCLGGSREDEAGSVIQDYDSGFIITGFSNSGNGDVTGNHGTSCFPYPCEDIWLVKIDSAGSLVWQKCFGGSLSDISSCCLLTPNGDYLLPGYSFSADGDITGHVNYGESDAWILKLSNQQVGINSNLFKTDNIDYFIDEAKILHINIFSDYVSSGRIELVDLLGRTLIYNEIIMNHGSNNFQIPVSKLNCKIFFLRITTKFSIFTGKVVEKK